MAEKNRADLQIVIDANLPDNTTDFITPLLHREVEEDLKDSQFNKPDDTAFNVNYPPTTPLDWGATVPTETGGGLDILIKKVSTNPSQEIAFFATNGSDTINEFEIGNPLKPFLTIQAAIDAIGNNGIVKGLGGVFTENITVTKINYLLDLSSITLNGNISVNTSNKVNIDLSSASVNGNISMVSSNNTTINNQNGNIIGDVTFNACNVGEINNAAGNIIGRVALGTGGSEDILLTGGKVSYSVGSLTSDVVSVGEGTVVNSVDISSTTNAFTIGSESTDINKRAFVTNCRITNTATNSYCVVDGAITVDTCSLNGYRIGRCGNSASNLVRYIDCYGKTTGEFCFFGATSAFIDVRGGQYKSANGNVIEIGGSASDVFFENAKLIAATNIVNFRAGTLRAAGVVNQLKGCTLFFGSANAFSESYNVSDLGTTHLSNCVVAKVGIGVVTKVTEFNSDNYVGLQEPLF